MRRNQSAFTMIELLVVISIIGLLMSVLGVALTNVMSKSKVQATKATIQKLESGISSYESAFSKLPPSDPGKLPDPDKLSGKRWKVRNFQDSGLLVGLLGQELKAPGPKDPATGDMIRWKIVGPFIEEFKLAELGIAGEQTGRRGAQALKQPKSRSEIGGNSSSIRIVDGWGREMGFCSPGLNHSSNCKNGSSNNTKWVDIWSRGTDLEKNSDISCPASGNQKGCNEDDINNF